MLLDATSEGHRVVDVYARVARYTFERGRAWEHTRDGRKEVTPEYARHEIARWREREARVLPAPAGVSRYAVYWMIAIGCFIFSIVTAFLLSLIS